MDPLPSTVLTAENNGNHQELRNKENVALGSSMQKTQCQKV